MTARNVANPSSPHRGTRIRAAVANDAEGVARVINAAFVVERVAFDGDRTNLDGVRALMNTGKFLLAEEEPLGLVGCVYIELRGDRSYLGLLSVAPELQGKGLGRQLVAAAEEYSRDVGCRAMELRVISPRAESLLPFYERLGYAETGTAPFPVDVPAKVPCHYIFMAKALA
jgi:GNAT superfamily N-acetyltransferase